MSTTIFRKFWSIFRYCRPISKVYKKSLVTFLKNGQNLNYRLQFKIVLFDIILLNMLFNETFEWYNLNLHHVIGSW